ncbi:MAG: response regulator [Terracidiphilus sp.]|nr:response regulator [Terracidiphilus sp.]
MKFATVPIEQVPPVMPLADVTAHRPLVLVVDDETEVADSLVQILAENGFAAVAAYDGPDAIDTAHIMPPELLVTYIDLPGMSGTELADAVKGAAPDCKVVLLSGPASTSELLVRVSESLKL